MKRSWFAALVVPFFVGMSGSAMGQTTVPAEITGYHDIMINFSETAHECNLKDEAMFADYVREKLAEIGLVEDPDSIITVNVGISGNAFGLLRTQCTSQTEIAFNTTLSAQNIVTDDPEVRETVDRLKLFPVTVYRMNMFGVQAQVEPPDGGESNSTPKAVMAMIDDMVEKFAAERAR